MNDDIDIWNEEWYGPPMNDDSTYDPGDLPFDVPEIIQPGGMSDAIKRGVIYYRSPGDDINVKRIISKVPNGCHRIANNIAIKGVSYRTEEVNEFVLNDPIRLSLVPEPTNEYDKNAIMIMGHYAKDDKEFATHVGYVPKGLAKKYKDEALKAQLLTVFVPHDGKHAGVRLSLWRVGKPEGAMI